MSAYQDYDAHAEKKRLRLQSEALEEISDRALARLGPLEGARVVDVACGAMGLLPALSRRVGPRGSVVGTDFNTEMVAEARDLCAESGLANVEVLRDDLFATALAPQSFNVAHARFVLAPLGRDAEVAAQLERIVKPGGWIVLEEPDGFDSWRVWPDETAHRALFEIIGRAYDRHMGGAHAGPRLLPLARSRGWTDVHFDAHVLGMPPGHPYLRAPIMMATALRALLLEDTPEAELDQAVAAAEAASVQPGACGVTFTLMQVWARTR